MADSTVPSQVPDPRLAQLEAQLERQIEVSRQATADLSMLGRQESYIAQSHRPPDPPIGIMTGWNVDTLMAHLLALREADRRFYDERDRRYAEVNVEKEKALKIKETADLAALQLAREIQTYKDEKANELRTQIERERSEYPTRTELKSAMDKAETGDKTIIDKLESAIGNWTREHTILVAEFAEYKQQTAGQPELRQLERAQERNMGEKAGSTEAVAKAVQEAVAKATARANITSSLAVIVSIAVGIVLAVHG